ncbi:hypothetical protein PoB_001635000 [Plakobranchus ocellatus]|uniref:Uncharacterized protein n=1 Tax=Plakobranchus ocellatus TaxID=259542 RepID=A0AAV3Z5J9_9GAST|nr:hypothetical protein PoB_001635000 [Plakobranchus ocellatus]
MHLFEIKVSSMDVQGKACALLLEVEEIGLKASLRYNPLHNQVEGFEDFELTDKWLAVLVPGKEEMTTATAHFFNLVQATEKRLQTV